MHEEKMHASMSRHMRLGFAITLGCAIIMRKGWPDQCCGFLTQGYNH
jgi:hypothetical protein